MSTTVEFALPRVEPTEVGADATIREGTLEYHKDTKKLYVSDGAVKNQVYPASGSGVSDGDKGDITVSSSGAVWTIDNDVVTFDKIQNIATDRILGRDTAGSGSIEELTVGTGLVISAGALVVSSFIGSTSVYHSTTQNVTTSAAALSFDSEAWDNLDGHDNSSSNSRIVVPATGIYMVGFTFRAATISVSQRPIFTVRVDGDATDHALFRYNPGLDGIEGSMTGSRMFSLTAGQYVEIWGVAAATVTLTGGANQTVFWVTSVA